MRPDLWKLAGTSGVTDDDGGGGNEEAMKGAASNHEATYDPRKRDPQFANAADAPLWEIVRQTDSSSLHNSL